MDITKREKWMICSALTELMDKVERNNRALATGKIDVSPIENLIKKFDRELKNQKKVSWIRTLD